MLLNQTQVMGRKEFHGSSNSTTYLYSKHVDSMRRPDRRACCLHSRSFLSLTKTRHGLHRLEPPLHKTPSGELLDESFVCTERQQRINKFLAQSPSSGKAKCKHLAPIWLNVGGKCVERLFSSVCVIISGPTTFVLEPNFHVIICSCTRHSLPTSS